jgi:hypothetical protein
MKKRTNNRKTKQARPAAYRLGRNVYTNFENPSRTFLDPHKYITLKYSETFSFSLASTVGTQQLMRLNSIFDPNSTGVGHQPYGYDQIAALYNRYRVLSTKWKITFGTVGGTYRLVVIPVNGALSSAISNNTTFDTACEVPRARQRTQGGGGSPTISMSSGIKLNDLNGVTFTEYLADDRFEAQIGANPAEVMNLVVGTYNPTAGSIDIQYSIEMEYHTDVHDPLLLAGS